MGSISGLISILLFVDLCTCSRPGQNQNLKMIYLEEFFWFMRNNDNKFYDIIARD